MPGGKKTKVTVTAIRQRKSSGGSQNLNSPSMGSGASAPNASANRAKEDKKPASNDAQVFQRTPVKNWDKPGLADENASIAFHLVQLNQPSPSQLSKVCADVNQPWVYCRRLLHYAAETNNAAIVDWLLKNGANATAQDADGWGAGHFAAGADAGEAIAALARLAPDCLTLPNVEGDTPLATAAAFGGARATEELLKVRKVNCNCVNRHGDTPLLTAVEAGHSNVASLLVNCKSVDLKYQSRDGRSAFKIAKGKKDERLLKLLKSKGVKS